MESLVILIVSSETVMFRMTHASQAEMSCNWF